MVGAELGSSAVEELGALRKRLGILRRADLILDRAEELDLMLEDFLELIMEAAQVASGTLYLVDEDRQEMIFAVVQGPAGVGAVFQDSRMPLGEGIAGKCALRGEAIWVPAVEHSRDWARELADRSGYRPHNALCLPLKVQEGVIGVVQLFDHPVESPYTQADLDFLGGLVNDLALKMENARLLDTSRQMVARLRALLDVGLELGATLDRDHFLNLILEHVCELLQAEAASVFELEEDTGGLLLCATTTGSFSELGAVRVPPGEGIAGWVAQHGETILVPDVRQDPRHYPRVDELSAFVTRSILCAPLVVQEQTPGQRGVFRRRVIGVAEALNKQGDAQFTQADIDIFEGLARQAAIGMERMRLYRAIDDLFTSTLMALAEAMEAKDPYTRGHTRRVTSISGVIAEELGLPNEEVLRVRTAAMLHDIGKIGMPDAILGKEGQVNDAEMEVIRRHPQRGERILRPLYRLRPLSHLREAIRGVAEHHERYDGAGYPRGLQGADISLAGRIIAVADTFDAMTSDRPYRKGLPVAEVLAEIQDQAGRQFDPQMVVAFMQAWGKGRVALPGTEMGTSRRSDVTP